MANKNTPAPINPGAVAPVDDEAWQREMEGFVNDEAATTEGISSGSFIGVDATGLTLGGSPLPNPMRCIILGSVRQNLYYPGEYVEGQRTPPTCFAVGTMGGHEADMVPAAGVEDEQNDKCRDCPQNAWESGKGKAKACKNTIRLAVLPLADDENPSNLVAQDPLLLSIPPTSLRAYKQYTKQLQGAGTAPPAVWSYIGVGPHKDYRIAFEFFVDPNGESWRVEPELRGLVLQKREIAKSELESMSVPQRASEESAPPPPSDDAEAPKPGRRVRKSSRRSEM